MLTFGSLFSGIGGIDLGLERAGMQCRWQSEIDPYASRVLAKHWPDIPNLGDVTKIDWRNVERTDVVAGGYPCQPFSTSGRRNGANDPRHLWPMFAECIRVVRPRYALLENVSGHLSLGFGHVLADLAALGYDCRWDCIPAASVGAPHLRDRVFVIATWRGTLANSDSPLSQRGCVSSGGNAQHADSYVGGCKWPSPTADPAEWRRPGPRSTEYSGDPAQSGEREANQPIHDCYWKTEPGVGRMANGVPCGVDRLRGLGNAVVPQVAEHVARIIIQDTQ
jgi:DNA (cytosine-5)-methyltransferase 1